MIKAIFDYSPHDRHKNWFVVKDEQANKFETDTVSPWDSNIEAHTVQLFYPLDNAIITFFPAQSVQLKSTPNNTFFKGMYFIILSNVADTEHYSSYKMYKWEDVIQIASYFKDMSFKIALKIWQKKKY
jgi:hypothetical protein